MGQKTKKTDGRRLHTLILIIITSGVLLTGCKNIELTSQWRNGVIAIDGANFEWDGATTYFEDYNAAIGLFNDNEYLYVSLLTTNRWLQNQILREGFTVWFDAEGGKNKIFGIRFPLGMGYGEMNPGGMDPGDLGGFGRPNFDSLQEVFFDTQTELEILGPDKDQVRRLSIKDVEDIFVAASVSNNGLIYELRIPLFPGEGQPYAIGAAAGDIIGLGLETPEVDLSMRHKRLGGRMPGGNSGGFPGGGAPGGMGGGGMRRGGPGGRSRPEMPQRLDLWAKVELAKGTSANTDNQGMAEK